MENTHFAPHDTGVKNGNYFGFPNDTRTADIILMSIPWDVTTSYKAGASRGPEAIIDASVQLDFFDFEIDNAWQKRIASLPIDYKTKKLNHHLRKQAEAIIKQLEQGKTLSAKLLNKQHKINKQCKELNLKVKEQCINILSNNIPVGLVGGDHSSPLGLLEALSEKYASYGILHIDAHADLRDCYEGFDFSHASIMYNALKISNISTLVQVAVRDMSEPEFQLANHDGRIKLFSDHLLCQSEYNGISWDSQCIEIVNNLPDKVYISFDIDGLNPYLCPNTGTPVPGGLDYNRAIHLLHTLYRSGKQIIGFDLCEVAPGKDDDWDANVGARVLYKLCQITSKIKTPR